GGILPLAQYLLLQRLLLDETEISWDGRLREQLQSIPRAEVLDLLNVKYVVTDKLLDLWFDNVYYDLQNRAVLGDDGDGELTLTDLPALSSTSLAVVSHVEGGRDLQNGFPVAEIMVSDEGGRSELLLLRAGEHTSEGVRDDEVSHDAPPVVDTRRRTVDEYLGQEYLAILPFSVPRAPAQITVRSVLPSGRLVLSGLTLIDQRTGAHRALTVSQGARLDRVHSGDVKVYENTRVLSRAFVVHHALLAADDSDVLDRLLDPTFDPAETVVLLESEVAEQGVPSLPALAEESTLVRVYEPERVVIETQLADDGYLVVSDTNYLGWKAWVDGRPVRILNANLLMRAVPLGRGEHLVEFRFEPESLRWGTIVSLTSLALVLIVGSICAARNGHLTAGRKPDRDV
ncbi:MAG TPA: YfhO family protein, partial [Anaerolineae bacterium]|nr:YfhO family protein [Anaerolineae bacterium]